MSRANTGSGGRQIYCIDYTVRLIKDRTKYCILHKVIITFKEGGGLQQGEGGLEVCGHGAGQALPLDIHCCCHR